MILIASNSRDGFILRPVIRALKARGEDVLVYHSDEVASGKVRAGMVVDRNARTTFVYGKREFSPMEVEAAWYKRANYFTDEELDEARTIYIDRQRRACQDSLWYSIPNSRWLNPPMVVDSIYENKIVQAHFAHEVGFVTPQTVISNDWNLAFHSFGDKPVSVKLPDGRMYMDDKLYHMLTTVVDKKAYERLRNTSPFPGIWQEFIQKKREWRVTVVGDKVFPAAVYTTKRAKADWRKLQFDGRVVKFKAEELPSIIVERCVTLLRRMGVHYGAFDLIECEDGSFVFLEVNLIGAYQWLVNKLGFAIPQAIADELIAIKNANKQLTISDDEHSRVLIDSLVGVPLLG
jgi:hypothetical protein